MKQSYPQLRKVVGDFFIKRLNYLNIKYYFCASKQNSLKRFFIISLSILLLVPSLGNVFVYLNFKIHQEEIVKNLCIQREMKKNECNGHCFLSKQLKKEAEKEKKEAENLKEKQELVYITSNSKHHLTSILSINRIKIPVFYPCEKPKSAQLGIFRPPLV